MVSVRRALSLALRRELTSELRYRRTRRPIFQTRWYPMFRLGAALVNKSADFFVLDLKSEDSRLYLQHYEEAHNYGKIQKEGNRRKLKTNSDFVEGQWDMRLGNVAIDIGERFHQSECRGLCMGARNGAEVRWFNSRLLTYFQEVSVKGTDIAESALQFPDMIVHDFHDPIPKDLTNLDFIYSNSLDQSREPELALSHWIAALKQTGALYVHMSRSHGKQGLSRLDPFACEPELFPYVVLNWLNGIAYVEQVIPVRDGSPANGVFVIRPIVSIEGQHQRG